MKVAWIVTMLVLVAAGVALLAWTRREVPSIPAPAARFVADSECAACHQDIVQQWTGSHHDLAMQPATPETVLADFDDARFEQHGRSTRFVRRDGKFIVETDDHPDGQTTLEVRHTFGVAPLQQYLVETGDGHVQSLPFCWDTERKQWFHLYGDEAIAPDDQLHWTGPYQNWNFMCAECHSTNLKRNYDPATGRYATSWSEIDVGCQSCHGPGSAHIAWAEKQVAGKTYAADDPKGLEVQLDDANSRVQIEHCARCHSRRDIVADGYEYGHAFLDHYAPQLPLEPLYHADGQIRDEVYVYGSFLQTKKYMAGVRCTDCHDPHRATLKFEGNRLCTECHQPNAPVDRFPTLQKKAYDTPEHHHHEPGTKGAGCVDCHMIERHYMQVDARRDHSFRIPRPDMTVKYGTPNACNDCHENRDAAWAVEQLSLWHGSRPNAAEPRPSEVLAAAQRDLLGVVPALAKLALDTKQPEILRASALRLLGRRGPSTARTLLSDSEGLVRLTAVETVRDRMGPETSADVRARLLAPLLGDPVRAVRAEAARALVGARRALSSPDQRRFDEALAEWRGRQEALLDRPGGWFNLGIFHEARGKPGEAERAYRAAIERDRHFLPARFHLANLFNRLGRNDDAEDLLREILVVDPENGEGHYSLGLLLAEQKRMDEAATALQAAAEKLDRPRIYYNLGLVLRELGRTRDAERALYAAHDRDRANPDVLHALTLLMIDAKRWPEAEAFATKLAVRRPGAPAVRQLMERIRECR